MKQFQKKLLTELIIIREEVLSNRELTVRKKKLTAAFVKVQASLEGHLAINFKDIIEQVLTMFGYDIDKIIEFLQYSIDNPFDARTLKEDVRDGFDSRYGTQTSSVFEQIELPEVISLERIKSSSRFHPTPIRIFRFALKMLKKYIGNYDQWVFIDIGTGLGRNLLLASELPFKKIIGIEISSFLSGKASENIRKYNLLAEQPCVAEVHCMDVLDFPFPIHNAVIYFWEPFKEVSVMEKLISIFENHEIKYKTKFILIFLGYSYFDDMPSTCFRILGVEYEPDSIDESSFFKISFYSM